MEHTVARLHNLSVPERAQISGYLRDEFNLGSRAHLDTNAVSQIVAQPQKQIPERLDRLLRWCANRQQGLDRTFTMDHEVVAITYSQTVPEVLQLIGYLSSSNYIKRISAEGKFQVTVDGFIENEKSRVITTSKAGFIAMWFDESMTNAREHGLSAGVRGAGYSPVLVNNVEHINKIDDEIIAQIRKSRFLVADFTGHRGGVYFEAGFALGLSLPVFWTCRHDDLNNLHFDIRQYNCIDWKSPEELAYRLSTRIEAVVGRAIDP